VAVQVELGGGLSTVRVTVKDPADMYVCVTEEPVPVEPSPKFQSKVCGDCPPVAEAVNVTGVPTSACEDGL